MTEFHIKDKNIKTLKIRFNDQVLRFHSGKYCTDNRDIVDFLKNHDAVEKYGLDIPNSVPAVNLEDEKPVFEKPAIRKRGRPKKK